MRECSPKAAPVETHKKDVQDCGLPLVSLVIVSVVKGFAQAGHISCVRLNNSASNLAVPLCAGMPV
eukprot:517443-Pleurochrysis_carterae.AAC.2